MSNATTDRIHSLRWLGLLVVSLAVSLIIVDSTIVNVAIPSIVDDIGITSTQVQWVQESYTLVFASLLLVWGTLADRVGRRRLLAIGVVIFGVASVIAAFSATGEALIAARVVQGVGGSMILPTTLSVLNSTFTGKERGIAFAVWGSTIGGMAAIGPLLGGWLTTDFSWRWAFGINVPFIVIILIGLFTVVGESRAPARAVDWAGAAISVVLFSSLVFGLIEGRTYGWWEVNTAPVIGSWIWSLAISPIPFAFAISILAAVAFVVTGLRRQRAGRSTMVPFNLFRIPSFRNGNITAMIVALGEFGVILALPLWLQNVLGYDALHVGFTLLALAIGSFVASGFAGAFSGKVAAVWVVRIGVAAEIVGLVIVASVISLTTEWWQVSAGLFIYGFGVGLATAQLTGVVLVDVPLADSGQASGMQSTSRQVGSALGIAILGTVLFSSLGGVLDAKLSDTANLTDSARTGIVDAVVDSSGSVIPSLEASSPAAATAAREAFSDATKYATLTAAGFLTVGLLATISLGSGDAARKNEAEDAEAEAPTAPAGE